VRTYLSERNLFEAAGLSAAATVLGLGRMARSGQNVIPFVVAGFLVMIFVCGMVTAWGREGGMAGILPPRARGLRGCVMALVVALIVLPVRVFWLDPQLREALVQAIRRPDMALWYPEDAAGILSLMGWSAGIQMLFLQAAPMAFTARLTGRPVVGVALALALRSLLLRLQLDAAGIVEGVPLFYGSAWLGTLLGCVVYARYGLLPAALLAAGMDLSAWARLWLS